MQTITIETSVGEIVRMAPARARIFESLGISYCCGGKTPLGEACKEQGLDPATVVAMLSALGDAASGSAHSDVGTLSLSDLCDHIEKVHHGYLAEELPRLDFMTRKVADVHGTNEPRLLDLRRVFEAFSAGMTAHTKDENENLFPMIRQLKERAAEGRTPENLKAFLEKLEGEHHEAGAALVQFRELTDNYTPPEWACNTFRLLYDGLAQLEKDTHEHVHKENNILFPKALAVA